jgi:Membrane protease subunits, stomatin/prohibitin homologs
MTAGIVVLILIGILVLAFFAKGLRIVPQSQTMVIERLGKYKKTLDSGVNIIVPFLDKPKELCWTNPNMPGGRKLSKNWIDLREQIFDYPKQNVITKDNVNIEIDALLYFQITDPMKAVYEVADLPRAIEMLTQTTLRNVLGELELDESLTSRDTINNKLRIILDEATDKWGVKVNRVELKDINPPASIQEEMEKQMKAERERRATILIAEGEKTAKILEAEGYKAAQISKAEGDAAAIVERAQAEAASIEKVKAAFDNGDDYTKYLIAIKYIDALEKMVSGKDNKVVYMPYEASGVLSSLGGIKDLLNK